MGPVGLLILVFVFVVVFSLLTVAEVVFLKKMGFDVIAHLRISHESGKKTQFFLEAFGVVAFVLGQPMLLTGTVVWAYSNVKPDVAMALKALPAILF